MIIVLIFIISTVIQLFYQLFFYLKFALYNQVEPNTSNLEPVSVIISAHNEDYNLQRNLKYILEQDYPEFEVVVVNHTSTDDTEETLKEFKRKYNNLSIVSIKQDLNFFKGKKFPLSIGIKSAKYNKLVLTDADCKPSSRKWLLNMAGAYKENTEIVLGYGPYYKNNGFMDRLVRYDTLLIAIQYFSFALRGLTYMGVGRNLSYFKSLFYKHKGFTSHYGIASGDDDLFIIKAATKTNVRIQINNDAMVYSNPKASFSSWFRQKSRHLSTGKVYPIKYKILLGLSNLTIVTLYFSFIGLLIMNALALFSLVVFLVYTFIRIIIQKMSAAKLGEGQLLLFSLIGELFHLLLIVAVFIRSSVIKKQHW